jgi:uncharacterized membrane protein
MSRSTRPPYDIPSWSDPVVRVATGVVGGPVGRHAVLGARGLAGVAAAVTALGAGMLALGVWQKGHCLMKGWASPDHFWRTCYSDITVVHVSSSLSDRLLPYVGESPSDQPLVSGLVMWVLALVSPQSGTDVSAQQWVFTLWALAVMLLLAAGVLAVVALRPQRPWQAAHLAVSPVIALLALVSTDLLGVVLVLYAVLAWERRHPAAAGALLATAFLMRPYPLVFLIAIVLVARHQGRVRDAAQAVVAALVTGVALYLPFVLVVPDGVLTAPRSWVESGAGYGALSLVPQLHGTPLPAPTVTWLALTGWLVAGLVGWLLTRRGTGSHDLVAVAAPMTLVVMVTAQSVPVQTGLWVLPFLALSDLRWRDHLVWAAAESLHFLAVWMHIGFSSDPGRGLPGDAYSLTIALRVLAWTWVLWQVWEAGRDRPVPGPDARVHRPVGSGSFDPVRADT